jgi:hypothetical protein
MKSRALTCFGSVKMHARVKIQMFIPQVENTAVVK